MLGERGDIRLLLRADRSTLLVTKHLCSFSQGPDFGYVTRESLFELVTSLDSFGNLEVSPPVTANGKDYPLGRILIGSSFPT